MIMKDMLLESMYVLCGLVSIIAAVYAVKDKELSLFLAIIVPVQSLV